MNIILSVINIHMVFVINVKLDENNNINFEINWITLTLIIYLSTK